MSLNDRFTASRFGGRRFRTATLIFVALVPLIATVHCGSNKDNSDREVVLPEWDAFIALARQATCADKRNNLYAIDHTLVLYDRAGSCKDGEFGVTLFGATPDQVLCQYYDTISGPQKSCPDPGYETMFDTIITHLDKPDLGLGPNHAVVWIPF